MVPCEKWHIARRKVLDSIIYRGKPYKLNRKYRTWAEADSHVAYLGVTRKQARSPYKGKRPPIKRIATVIRKLMDERGRRWFVVYIREY